jgi:predicted nucleic acid-binding protein
VKLVVNASPLILLTAAEQLSLLPALADEIVVPGAVFRELKAGESRDLATTSIRSAKWAKVVESPPASPSIAAWDLGAGETAVLSWAERQTGFTCVLDDRAARNCARAVGLPYVGTLGLVLAAKEAGLLATARPVLERMSSAGYFLAGKILEQALRDLGE